MTRIIYTFIALLLCAGISAQIPQGFNYQAIARDASGTELEKTILGIRISIYSGTPTGTLVWQETHTDSTNEFGLFTLMVGDTNAINSGGSAATFDAIDWGSDNHFMKVEVDPEGGTAYGDMGPAIQLLSVPYALHAQSSNTVYGDPVSISGSVGIGTESPLGKLEVVGDIPLENEDPLFEVKRSDGLTVFAVYNEGVRAYVENNAAKGSKGGFAVGGIGSATKAGDEEYLRVTPDSVRIYVRDSVTVKGSKGGFAVGGFKSSKSSASDFMSLTPDNYFIGHEAGASNTTGLHNSFFGYLAGYSNTEGNKNLFFGYESGTSNLGGDYNVCLGHQTGHNNTSGHENVFIGYRSGYSNSSGYDNIFIGNLAGENASGNTHSTFIGNEAGRNMTGDDNTCIGDRTGTNDYVTDHESFGTVILGIDAGRNITGYDNTVLGYAAGSSWGGQSSGDNNTFVGMSAGSGGHLTRLGSDNVCLGYRAGYGKTGSDKLYIANNSTTTLIYGEFDNKRVVINGVAEDNPSNYTFYANGTAGGDASWNSLSDGRLKQNIMTIDGALDKILKLRGVYFDWKDPEMKGKQIGFIAQETMNVIPEVVDGSEKSIYSMQYAPITAVLVEAVKEQQTLVEKLENENIELKKRLEKLEEMVLSK